MQRRLPCWREHPSWLALAQAGRLKEAWERLVADNPFPSVHGRVCYHPCESNCNRRELDGAVRIHAVERLLGDRALRDGWRLSMAAQPSGKRILIVGQGPLASPQRTTCGALGMRSRFTTRARCPGGMLHFRDPRVIDFPGPT